MEIKRIAFIGGMVGVHFFLATNSSHSIFAAPPAPGLSVVESNGPTPNDIPLFSVEDEPSPEQMKEFGLLERVSQLPLNETNRLQPIVRQPYDRDAAGLAVIEDKGIETLQHLPSLSGNAHDSEVVRERYKNGSLHIERQVALDSKGNYVNHGNYREWDASGRVIAEGNFVKGNRDGHWIRICEPADFPLFQAYPYSDFIPPLKSEADFLSGHLHGIWKITDAENRLVSEISLQGGYRDGPARWYHATGELMYETNYTNGVLDGSFTEWTADGDTVKQDQFVRGQRKEANREYYPNKQPKVEYQSISASQALKQVDDWWLCRPAAYEAAGESIKEGAFTAWYENGQIKARGFYSGNQLHGRFESWYPNNQKESAGEYQMGNQQGLWSWWHPNGMKKSVGNYEDGRIVGTWSAWQPDGKMIETKISQPLSAPAQAYRRSTQPRR